MQCKNSQIIGSKVSFQVISVDTFTAYPVEIVCRVKALKLLSVCVLISTLKAAHFTGPDYYQEFLLKK